MAGIFEAIRFSDPIHGPSDTTDFLADVRNSVVNVEIDVRFETYVLAQSAVLGSSGSIEIAPNPANTGLVADVRTIWANKSNAFEGFQVGDRIFVVGAPTPANNGFAQLSLGTEKPGDGGATNVRWNSCYAGIFRANYFIEK